MIPLEGSNPLKDITQTEHVTFVMRAGHVYKRPASENLARARTPVPRP